MSATLSEATGRPYGIQRVCQAWERSRSALYARQTREQQRHKGEEPARRGPTPTVSDATLLEAIQADLDRSPFQGEGHRKVHARLRILDGIRVARTAGAAGAAGAQAALPAPRPPGRRAGACRDDRHAGAERDVGHRRRAGLHVGRRVGAGSSQRSSTGTRSVWDGTCARLGAGLRRSSRSPRGSGASMAPSTPTALEGWRCGWTTARHRPPEGLGGTAWASTIRRERRRTRARRRGGATAYGMDDAWARSPAGPYGAPPSTASSAVTRPSGPPPPCEPHPRAGTVKCLADTLNLCPICCVQAQARSRCLGRYSTGFSST